MANPFRQVSNRRLPPFPGERPSTADSARRNDGRRELDQLIPAMERMTVSFVKSFLTSHTNVLEDYIMENVDQDHLEEWLVKKKTEAGKSLTDLTPLRAPALQARYSEVDLCCVQKIIESCIDENKDLLPILYELAHCLGKAMRADSVTLYSIKSLANDLCIFAPSRFPGEESYELRLVGPVGRGTTVAAHVAATKQTVLVRDLLGDERFPKGIGIEGSFMHSVLCVPITLPSNEILCVMEYTKSWDKKPFTDVDLQTSNVVASWVGIALHHGQVNFALRKQGELNDFLLQVSKKIFDDVVEIDGVVENIMLYTKDLVCADRCALFLVDEEKQELFANLLDEGKYDEKGKPVFTLKKDQIRFPISKGIAGHVARTGEVVNIHDAYSDPRFNRNIDHMTGYVTRNILCMPIVSKGEVIGVVQMVNKMNTQSFTQSDEYAFKMFAVYCAMALHYSKMFMEIQLKSAHYSVALEQVSFHAKCSDSEYSHFLKNPMPRTIPEELDNFAFYGPSETEKELPQYLYLMVENLFGEHCFDKSRLCRFLLTVRVNYRPVAYHNWKHGFNVAHCIYCIFRRIKHRNIFPELKMMAILIGALCHDVDHRGYNNAFFGKVDDPLSVLYSNSVMERHHYAETVRILQQEGHDIFEHLSPESYKQVLDWIRTTIIATDLALFFPNQKELAELVETKTFSIHDDEHKEKLLSLMMTAADLSAVVKPWQIQGDCVKYVYEEFYFQGDVEKQLGFEPLPMFDRDQHDNMPKNQVSFLKFVCMPCYSTLSALLPECSSLEENCQLNLMRWECVAAGGNPDVWMPGESLPPDASDENNDRDASDENNDRDASDDNNDRDASGDDADEAEDRAGDDVSSP